MRRFRVGGQDWNYLSGESWGPKEDQGLLRGRVRATFSG